MTKEEKDDHDWLETIAGREVTNADPRVVAEAMAVRRVMRKEKSINTLYNYLGDTDGNLGDC